LQPDLIQTDVADFEQAIAEQSPNARTLYAGTFLPGCYYDWALDEANRLQALYDSLPQEETVTKKERTGPRVERQSIPNPASRFYGRGSEIAQITQAIRSECRLLSLVGLGGIGKTRLAIEVGRALPEHVVFVELAGVKDQDSAINRIAESLQVVRNPIDKVAERVMQSLNLKPTFLILDNLEDLVESGQAELVCDLLENVQELRVLATSRVPLGCDGEHLFPVPPLDRSASASLFLDRAKSVLPDFKAGVSLVDLCDRLDHLPLAIELCASWSSVLSTERMLESLNNRFHWLESRRRSMVERHKSLSAVLRWSCPLDSELMTSLRQLLVFEGSWDLEAAEAVLGDSAPMLLDRLLERSLIQSAMVDGEVRFSMLQTVREYAQDGLDEAVLELARRRHCRFYCRLSAVVAKNHAVDQHRAFWKLDTERSNIFTAYEYGLNPDAELTPLVVSSFDETRWCWWVRGYEKQVQAFVAIIGDLNPQAFEGSVRAHIFRFQANRASSEGDYARALDCLTHSIAVWDQLGDRKRVLEASHLHAIALGESGNYGEAESAFTSYLQAVGEDKRTAMIGLASFAAMLARGRLDPDRVERFYQQMIEFWEMEPDGESHVAVLQNALAFSLLERHQFDQAENLLKQAIQTLSKLEERAREAVAWDSIARALQGQGRMEESAQAVAMAEKIRQTAQTITHSFKG